MATLIPPTYIFIKGATILSQSPVKGVLSNADILVENEVIKAVGTNLSSPTDGSLTIIDASDSIVTPGFVDGHHHMWQQLIRGIATDWSLFDYLVSIRSMYGSVYMADDVRLAYYAAALDLLNNGVTTVLEHCHIINSSHHADAAIQGLKDAGIRGCFCYGFYQNPSVNGFDIPDVDFDKFDETQRIADARRVRETHFGSNDPADELLTFGIAPTEPESQPLDETVRQVLLSRELGARIITMHVAMGPYDTAHQEVVQHLANANLLGPDLVFSHGTSLTDGELNAIRTTGAGLVGTPDTELQMGMGFPAVFRATDKGCKACLGLDITSNQGNDFVAQMRLALQVQRAVDNQTGFPVSIKRKTGEILRMGTLGGAEVLGLDHLIGSITVGKKADLVIFKCDDISTMPVLDPTNILVFHTSSGNIDTVIVNGRLVKRHGRLLGVDWPALRADLLSRSERIRTQASTVDLATARKKWLEIFSHSR